MICHHRQNYPRRYAALGALLFGLLPLKAAQAQAVTYDSARHHDFAASHPAVAAGQTFAAGWTDQAGGIYSVTRGSLRATSADKTGYLRGLALRPAGENADTPDVQGTLFVPNGLPTPGTVNGLVLRFQPGGTFYLFQLATNTLYAYKITGGTTVTRLGSVGVNPVTSHPYSLTGSARNALGGGVTLTVTAKDTRTGKAIGSVSASDKSKPITQAGQVGIDSWVGNNEPKPMTALYARIMFSRLPPAPPSKASPKVGFIGDSITSGYNQYGNTITPGTNDVATLTVQALTQTPGGALTDDGIPWSSYDQGNSGSSTGGWQPGDENSLESRAKTAFTEVFGKPDPKTNPVWVLVMLGTNDVRSDNHYTAEKHQNNLQAIADDLVASGYNVVFNHAPAFVTPTQFNGVTWDADSLNLLRSYLPGEQAVIDSFATRAPGRVFLGDTSAFGYFASHPMLFQEYGVYGGLHPNGVGGTMALAGFWAQAFTGITHN